MNNAEIIKILRICNKRISCMGCPISDICDKARREKKGGHFHDIVADRLERMEKQLARLKREKGALIRYLLKSSPCALCKHRHFEGNRCPLHSPGKNGGCVNWTYDSEFAESEGANNAAL